MRHLTTNREVAAAMQSLFKTRRWMFTVLSLFAVIASVAFPLAAAAAAAARAPDGVLYFRLRLNSLDPPTLTIPEGRYVLRVSNGAVIGDISVQLEDDEKKSRLVDKGLKKGTVTLSRTVDLQPGRYT